MLPLSTRDLSEHKGSLCIHWDLSVCLGILLHPKDPSEHLGIPLDLRDPSVTLRIPLHPRDPSVTFLDTSEHQGSLSFSWNPFVAIGIPLYA